MIPPQEGIFKKVLVPRAGTEAAAAPAPTAGGAHHGGGEKGSTEKGRGAWEAAWDHAAQGEGPKVRRRHRGCCGKLENPRPQAIPPQGASTGLPEPSEKDHGCPRASASVPKIGGASHLGTGTGERASSLRCLDTGGLPTPFPQPAGGATEQQREPVSPFITSRPRRQRRVGGDCRPRYVSSITPAPADCAGAGSGLPPVPPPAHTRGPHPYSPRAGGVQGGRRSWQAGLGCDAPARGFRHATVTVVTSDLPSSYSSIRFFSALVSLRREQ